MATRLNYLLPFLFFVILPISCAPDEVEPVDEVEAPDGGQLLEVRADKTEVRPFDLLYLSLNGGVLEDSYEATFGSVEANLSRINDTLAVVGIPDLAPGRYKLKSKVKSGNIEVDLTVVVAEEIENPAAYITQFIAQTDFTVLRQQLDLLVSRGNMSAEQADVEFENLQQEQETVMEMVGSHSLEEQKVAASIISNNRETLDDLRSTLLQLKELTSEGGRIKFDAFTRAKIRTLKLALGKIGAMVVVPGLIAGHLGGWPPAGATLGLAVFQHQIKEQIIIAVTATNEIFSNDFIPVESGFSAVNGRTKSEEFVNGVPRRANIKIKLRNLQPSDESSTDSEISSFVLTYKLAKAAWDLMRENLPGLPEMFTYHETDVEASLNSLALSVVENEKVKGSITEENDEFQLTFTTGETDEQQFRYAITYQIEGWEPLKIEFDAVLLPVQFSVTILEGDNQEGLTNEILQDSLILQVKGHDNKPMVGFNVTWSVIAGDGQVAGTPTTDREGRAGAQWKLGSEGADNEVEAIVKDPSGKPITGGRIIFVARGIHSYELKYVLGNNQRAPSGSILPDPLIVRLVDDIGLPVPGKQIKWSVLQGSGSIMSSTQTDENGESAAIWKLGQSGIQEVDARYTDENNTVSGPVTFNAQAARLTIKYYSGNDQESSPGEMLPEPLIVEIVDADGIGVGGVRVDWSFTSGTGTLSYNQSYTNNEGRAYTNCTVSSSGSYTIEANANTAGQNVDGGVIVFSGSTYRPQEMSAFINGSHWSATSATTGIVTLSNGIGTPDYYERYIQGKFEASPGQVGYVYFYFESHFEPYDLRIGSYPIGSDDDKSIFSNFTGTMSVGIMVNEYSFTPKGTSTANAGMVTITSIEDGVIEGSFYFTIRDYDGNIIYQVTNGAFKVTETN